MLRLTSPQNEKLKWLGQLHKASVRRRLGLFLVEGQKEINFALQAGYRPHSFYSWGTVTSQKLPSQAPLYDLSRAAYEKVTYRTSQVNNLLGVFYDPKLKLADLKLGPQPFLIVVETIEKPGNLGAIIRTADGAAADAVIVGNEYIDIYNPNVIRSSVGCIFIKPVVSASNQAVLNFLKSNNIQVYGAALVPESKNYLEADFKKPSALILGSEASGLSSFWLKNSQPIVIPMKGKNDSLNVSSAAAVLAYEVQRQRHD